MFMLRTVLALLALGQVALAAPTPSSAHIAATSSWRAARDVNAAIAPNTCKNGVGCSCPVCGMALTAESPYLEFARSQKIHACSDAHLSQFEASMGDFVVDDSTTASSQPGAIAEATAAHAHTHEEVEGTRCPICGMDGDAHNAIDFRGSQALFLCPMETQQSKDKLLSNPKEYISSKSTGEGKGSGEASSQEAYCSGRTVMYMSSGFTWDDAVCLVFFYSGFVIDSRAKLWLAMLATFALAVLHEWLMKVRRRLVYLQREARMQQQQQQHNYFPLSSSSSSSLAGVRTSAGVPNTSYPQYNTKYAGVNTSTRSASAAVQASAKTPLLSGATAAAAQSSHGRRAGVDMEMGLCVPNTATPWGLRTLDISVALLYGASLSLGYIVMLAVMTYKYVSLSLAWVCV